MKGFYKAALLMCVVLCAFLFIIPTGASFLDDEGVLTAKNIAEGIELQWTAVDDAYYYEVYRQTSLNGEKVLLSKVQDTAFVDDGTVNGKGYLYTIDPVLDDFSYDTEMKTVIYRVGQVKISRACAEKTGLKIEWSPLKEATGYQLLRRTEENEEWTVVASCPADETYYVDRKVEPEVKYSYSVKAFTGKYEGIPSEATELSYIGYPEITGCVSAQSSIRLSWSKVPSSVYYLVYRKSEKDSLWRPYALLDGEYTTYEDKDVKQGVKYSYTVRAVDEAGKNSYYDDPVTMLFLGKPMIKTAASDTEGVKLIWTKSAGCDGYAVYRKDFGRSNWKFVRLVKGQDSVYAVDTTAINNTPYTYTVRAVWNKNLSAFDEKGVNVRFMQAPQSLECFINTKYGNVLRWQENTDTRTFFCLQKS